MIISGKDLSTRLKQEMASEVATYTDRFGRVPHLVVILVGEDPASQTYVRNKGLAAEKIGMRSSTIRLAESTTEEELLNLIDSLNADDSVDGILVQLPVPKHIDELKVLDAIDKSKDVDGFHPLNMADLWRYKSAPVSDKAIGEFSPFILPCTPKGCIKMIKAAGVEISGKHAVVLGRSNIVGLPVAKLLLNENATVTICHSRTKNLAEFTRNADIIIAAIGKPKFLTADMVSPGAVVIDVGIDRDPETGKLCGDVDFENVEPKCSVISPVPGGVGPMTICCLMENTIEAFLHKMEAK
ncbi:MAG: bifunctional methylenetetrahydrofolate dehydrogenase/methenyltetrahydrofolate cyclohydrolase FolD [Bacteroidales bacterium]|nr:bifunctional methylenetetrahydrofolate dehydrogenase/methenyltetrahydrofolate cyclohydrolase FolD [Candidatus Cryptobacteroides caccocaballi]